MKQATSSKQPRPLACLPGISEQGCSDHMECKVCAQQGQMASSQCPPGLPRCLDTGNATAPPPLLRRASCFPGRLQYPGIRRARLLPVYALISYTLNTLRLACAAGAMEWWAKRS